MPRFEGSAARKLKPVIPSERAEYVPPMEMKRKLRPKEVPEEKVILPEKVKQAEEEERQKKAEELRERLHPSAEKLAKRSENERGLAKNLIEAFRQKLQSGKITETSMDQYGEELEEVRQRLESLQADARRVPAGEKIGDIVNENFRAIDEIEAAIRATKMEPQVAQSELQFGAGVRRYEKEEESKTAVAAEPLEGVIERIHERFGAHPEELMAGDVPGMKGFFSGVKFRFLNSLAHIAGQKSEYDLYREALRADEATRAKLPEMPVPLDRKKKPEGVKQRKF